MNKIYAFLLGVNVTVAFVAFLLISSLGGDLRLYVAAIGAVVVAFPLFVLTVKKD